MLNGVMELFHGIGGNAVGYQLISHNKLYWI